MFDPEKNKYSSIDNSPFHLLILLLLGPLFLASQPNAVITNPSVCQLNLLLADNTCPENSTFFDPDIFHVIVNSSTAVGSSLGTDVYLNKVRLLIEHEWVSDLRIILKSPNGQSALLVANTGGNQDHFGDPSLPACSGVMEFQLAACIPIADGTAPFTEAPYRAINDFYIFNDGSDPQGVWELLICDDLVDDTGILQYIELVFEPLNCLPIQDIQIDAIDSTSVTFSYEPTSLCGPAILEVGPVGFTPGLGSAPGAGGQVFNVDCPPFQITGLTENTAYEVYLRRSCQGGASFSANSCGNQFTTSCRPMPITAVETFDEQTDCINFCTTNCPMSGSWRNTQNDDFDWLVNSGPTPTLSGTGPTDDITGGGNYVYLEANGLQCAVGAEAYLHSACIVLDKQNSDTCHLSFNYHLYGISMGALRLEVSTDGGFNWVLLWTKSGNQGDQWNKAYIGLDQFSDGSLLQFRFVGTKGNGVYGDMAIDQITFYGSTVLSYPENNLYADTDNDGFGANEIGIPTCLSTPPSGYSFNNFDCNDNDENINPDAEEIPCNSIDENCNAAFLDDDPFLSAPVCVGDTICSEETPLLIAIADDPSYTILWYDTPDKSGGIVGFGNDFSPTLPANNSPFVEEYIFYAEATNFICSSIALCQVTVQVLPRPKGIIGDEPEICPGESTDLAAVTVTDAHFTNASITYHTESPANAGNQLGNTLVQPTNTTPYIFLLTSAAGCTFEDTIMVNLKAGPQIAFSPADSFSLCKELRDTITASATGGAGGYTFLWETGRMTNTLPVMGSFFAGTLDAYSLTVTDAEGCYSVDSVLVQTTNSIDSLRVFTEETSSCMSSDGQITIVPLNGLGPFSYAWEDENGNTGSGTNVPDTIVISNLAQNTYRVFIADNSTENCEVQLRNIRVQGPGFQLGETQIQHPACAGDSDGEICLDASGTGTITYNWSDGQNQACATNLSAGTYSVTISNGTCTTIESYELIEPDSLFILSQIEQPHCEFNADGTIDIQIFGGTPNYTIAWEDGFVIPNRSNLSAGNYAVTITDAQSCVFADTIALPAPIPVQMVLDSMQHVSCMGQSDGNIFLSASGGTPPYTFQWTDGPSTPFRVGLSAGTYTVLIRDVFDCLFVNTITIEEPDILAVSLLNKIQPLCFGDETGEIHLAINGGTAPYEVIWLDGFVGNSSSRTNLGVDDYRLYIKDANDCFTDTLFVDLPPQSNLAIDATIQDATCIGVSDGVISVNVGGVEPINYQWSTTDNTANLSNIQAGFYSLSVSDSQGCEADTIFEVQAPQVFNITSVVSQPSCAGTNDGIIDQSFVNQPSGPISFIWSDASQHVDRFFLEPGDYAFTVTENNTGCQFYSDTFHLINPRPLSLSILDSGGLACAGDSTGFFETTGLGGTPPYTYNWIGAGVTTSNIYNRSAGTHRLILTDSRNCVLDTTLLLEAPPLLTVFAELYQPDICHPDSIDQLIVSHTGGIAPFNYKWNSGEETNSIIDPAAGDYFISVTDQNGCTEVYGTIKVQEHIEALQLDTFYVNQVNCFGGNDAEMIAITTGGSPRLQYHFTPTHIDTTNLNIVTVSGLSHSLEHSVTVTDITTGCSVESENILGVQPMPITIMRDSFQQVTCAEGTDGALWVSVAGGTAPLSFQWYDDDSVLVRQEEDLIDVPESFYTLVVTDANLCTAQFIDSNIIALFEQVFLESSMVTSNSCFEDENGAIDIEISGGSTPYHYLWSNESIEEDISGLPAGNYEITITDHQNCTTIFTGFLVEEPDMPILIEGAVDSISCFDETDGSIQLMVTGGEGNYTYKWRRNGIIWPSQTGPIITNLPPTSYVAIVEDSLGCIAQETFVLSAPNELLLEIINQPAGVDSLFANYSGGTPPYSFLWSTSDTTYSIQMLESGNYNLTITDSEGCQVSGSFLLTDMDEITLNSSQWSVYPNPTNSTFRIENQQKFWKKNAQISIWNVHGERIMTKVITEVSDTLEVDASNWPTGVYLIRLETPKGLVDSKFILRQ